MGKKSAGQILKVVTSNGMRELTEIRVLRQFFKYAS